MLLTVLKNRWFRNQYVALQTLALLTLVTLWRVLFYTEGGWPGSSEFYYTVTFSSSSGDMPNVLAGVVILSL